MNDPLQLPLRDVYVADAVNWWPLAIGWWLIIVLILSLVIAIVYFYRKKKAYAKSKHLHARLEFQCVKQNWQQHRDDKQLLNELSSLLRKISLNFYPREKVASLTDDAWLDFLNRHVENNEFSSDIGSVLKDAPYKRRQEFDAMQLLALCETWVNNITDNAKQAKAIT